MLLGMHYTAPMCVYHEVAKTQREATILNTLYLIHTLTIPGLPACAVTEVVPEGPPKPDLDDAFSVVLVCTEHDRRRRQQTCSMPEHCQQGPLRCNCTLRI